MPTQQKKPIDIAKTAVIGIDPGKKGALAAMTCDGGVTFLAMPIVGKDIDLAEVADWIRAQKVSYERVVVVIEKVGAMPGQGVTSMFSFGFVTGAMYGICAALRLPVHVPTPQAWKKIVLAGTNKSKTAAVEYVQRVYPGMKITATERGRIPSDGIADAICIAKYGWDVVVRHDL
jgi:crossover junction endodeoxyribonuclease RuvC